MTNSLRFTITTWPGDALWFNEHNGNKIGRITTAGVITEFPLATPLRVPHEITVGPDGAPWFTEENRSNRTHHEAGATAEFAIPTSNGHPVGIAKGPDKALWFTEYAGNKIGRLSVPALKVLPATNIAASGTQGQAFSPTSFRYRLSATSVFPMDATDEIILLFWPEGAPSLL
jgi:virginiamycin B lyase